MRSSRTGTGPTAASRTTEPRTAHTGDGRSSVDGCGPVVIVIDDIHLSDHATLLFTRFLARAEPPPNALVVITARPGDELDETRRTQLDELARDADEFPLGHLDHDDVVQLLRAGGVDHHDSSLIDALVTLTGGLILGVLVGRPADAVAGLAVGGALGIALYAGGGLGGGDAKLIGALGALLGPVRCLEATCWAFAAGAVGSVFLAWRSGVLPAALRELRVLGTTLMTPGASPTFRPPRIVVRFGPFVALGVYAVCWWPAARFLGS